MNLLLPSQLTTLTPEALIILLTLLQVSTICGEVKEADQVVPAAKQAKTLLDELIAMAPEPYQEMLAAMSTVANMAAEFDAEQVKTVGGILTRLPLFVGAAIPKIMKIGQKGADTQAGIFHET